MFVISECLLPATMKCFVALMVLSLAVAAQGENSHHFVIHETPVPWNIYCFVYVCGASVRVYVCTGVRVCLKLIYKNLSNLSSQHRLDVSKWCIAAIKKI